MEATKDVQSKLKKEKNQLKGLRARHQFVWEVAFEICARSHANIDVAVEYVMKAKLGDQTNRDIIKDTLSKWCASFAGAESVPLGHEHVSAKTNTRATSRKEIHTRVELACMGVLCQFGQTCRTVFRCHIGNHSIGGN